MYFWYYLSSKWPQIAHLEFDKVEIVHRIFLPETAHFKVYNCRMSAIFKLIELTFFRTYHSLKPHLLLKSSDLAITSCVKSGRRSAILHLFKLKYFTVYPHMKPHFVE